jgi:hypothetical protein
MTDQCSRYRAELLSILTSLQILVEVASDGNTLCGNITLECGHKRVLKEAFHNAP